MNDTTAWRVWVQEGQKRALIIGVFADRTKAEQHRDLWRDVGLGVTCITPASPSDIDEPSDHGWISTVAAYERRRWRPLARNLLADAVIRHSCLDLKWPEADNE